MSRTHHSRSHLANIEEKKKGKGLMSTGGEEAQKNRARGYRSRSKKERRKKKFQWRGSEERMILYEAEGRGRWGQIYASEEKRLAPSWNGLSRLALYQLLISFAGGQRNRDAKLTGGNCMFLG